MAEWQGRIGPKDEVTLDEACELLSSTPDSVATLIEVGALPARTNGSATHISLADIEVYRLRSESEVLTTSNLDRVRRERGRLLSDPVPVCPGQTRVVDDSAPGRGNRELLKEPPPDLADRTGLIAMPLTG